MLVSVRLSVGVCPSVQYISLNTSFVFCYLTPIAENRRATQMTNLWDASQPQTSDPQHAFACFSPFTLAVSILSPFFIYFLGKFYFIVQQCHCEQRTICKALLADRSRTPKRKLSNWPVLTLKTLLFSSQRSNLTVNKQTRASSLLVTE